MHWKIVCHLLLLGGIFYNYQLFEVDSICSEIELLGSVSSEFYRLFYFSLSWHISITSPCFKAQGLVDNFILLVMRYPFIYPQVLFSV